MRPRGIGGEEDGRWAPFLPGAFRVAASCWICREPLAASVTLLGGTDTAIKTAVLQSTQRRAGPSQIEVGWGNATQGMARRVSVPCRRDGVNAKATSQPLVWHGEGVARC